MPKSEKEKEQDFLSYVTELPSSCWRWNGYVDSKGYAHYHDDPHMVYAHVWVYEYVHGKLPENKRIIQTCEYRACVNPDHGKKVSIAVWEKSRKELKKHCRRGHMLTPENTYSYTFYTTSKRTKKRIAHHQRMCKQCIKHNRQKQRDW